MKKLLLVVFCFVVTITSAQNETLFEQGKNAYESEQYSDAITRWMQIIEKGQHSAAVYFNLGNAHYKLNQIGPSIYYYEKALQLDPDDSDIKNNLAFAKNATVDAIEPLPTTFFNKWYNRLISIASYDTWAVLAVTCSVLFAAAFLLYFFTYRERTKRTWFVVATISLVFLMVSVSLSFVVQGERNAKRAAIVFAEEVIVRAGPTMGSDAAFALHEGTKVSILASEGDWLRIAIADGKDGWLPATEVKEL